MDKAELKKILGEHKKWWLGERGGKRADLQDADLRGADLWDACLRDADLRGAYLQGAYLQGADLRDADLRGAYLQGAYLQGADLRGACLHRADLQGTYLRGAKNSELAQAITKITPEGRLVVWKKCMDNVLVKLEIPTKAKRSNATGRKCRAEYAKVLDVIGGKEGVAFHDGKTKYRTGETVRPHEWCEDRWQECAGGIHFFLTREEAEGFSL